MRYKLIYTVTFHTYWHCGSGLASGADSDSLVIKDKEGFPYIPGKTMKGLLREAGENYLSLSKELSSANSFLNLFGFFDDKKMDHEALIGDAFFSDAVMNNSTKEEIKEHKEYLFHRISSTKMAKGVAVKNSLRTTEVVIPSQLTGEILNISSEEMAKTIVKSTGLIKYIGTNRHRGLGRCEITAHYQEERHETTKKSDSLNFKCTLLSDVIINQNAATSGNQLTLDFIPGSNFRGIAASTFFKEGAADQKQHTIFFSGLVRFGDAHPSCGNSRSLRIPASFYYPKGECVFADEITQRSGCKVFVHHQLPEKATILNKEEEEVQLKQCREGFIGFEGENAYVVNLNRSFAIKSAYSPKERRSADKKMFGYESIEKGLELFFSVYVDDTCKEYKTEIIQSLVGVKRVGRSRSAQYGLVRIEQIESYTSPQSEMDTPFNKNLYAIYADSRLIFLDSSGMPTFKPLPKDLGFTDTEAKIRWEYCQIRTFQYSPWNFTRKTRDADRCGIEKGSIFVVESNYPPQSDGWVGTYLSEGFGKVIFNPSFFNADGNGKSRLKFSRFSQNTILSENEYPKDDDLITLLEIKKIKDTANAFIYKTVNLFCSENKEVYKSASFNSQWGQLRNIAQTCNEYKTMRTTIFNFISTGIKTNDWQGEPKKKLEEFFTSIEAHHYQDYGCLAIINLASMMTK